MVLSFNDGSILTIADAFEVINSRGPVLTLDILGPSGPRLGREATYLAVVRNIGVNDSYPGRVVVSLDEPGSVLIAGGSAVAASGALPPLPKDLLNTSLVRIPPSGLVVLPVPHTPSSADCRKLTGIADDPCAKERAAANAARENLIIEWLKLFLLFGSYIAADCPSHPNTDPCLLLHGGIILQLFALRTKQNEYDAAIAILALCERKPPPPPLPPVPIEPIPPLPDMPPPPPPVPPAMPATTSQFIFCPITSWDPNDKVGIEGIGAEGYLSSSLPFPYTVHFENLPSASASAQDVIVVDQLDANLDWTTFELGGIRFGDRFVEVPPESQHFATTVDLRPGLNIAVEIDANLDPNTGRVTWQFRSIDPDTGGFPADPSAGFLPPNIVPPEGEGSVSFTVRAKKSVQTGTEIHNQATIVFDVNPPIVTNQWVNTIDNSAPQSEVLPLAATQPSPTFQVDWAGTDGESGVREYTVYVSENDGPATVLLNNTTETAISFTGKGGSTYAFYSMAMDYAGNVEDIPQVPDASTRVVLPALVAVPVVTGLAQADAQAAILAAGLTVGDVTTANSPTVPAGNVISQNPAAGTSVAASSAVDLLVSLGPAMVAVPVVTGLTQADAQAAILAAGLTVGTVTTANSPTVPAGHVISQNPAADTNVAPGSPVDLVVSLGAGGGLRGDLDGDGCVGSNDVNILLAAVRSGATNLDTQDINGDGVVNRADARALMQRYTNLNGVCP